MKDLLDKISSYNLFNYFFPGVVFVVILEKISIYNLIQKDLLVGAFFYYFIGLVVSRVGSIFVEPSLKKISFLKFSDYGDFISASEKDSKIELFSEVNNMYRTLTSLFLILTSIKFYELIANKFPALNDTQIIIFLVVLFVLFLFSYRKQTDYITKRVEAKKKESV